MHPLNNTDVKSATFKWRIAGRILIALGFLIPQVHVYIAGDGPGVAGYDLAKSFGQLLALGVLSWLVTRNKTDHSKAQGTFFVGLLMVLSSAMVALNNQTSQSDMKAYLEKATALQDVNKTKLVGIIDRMNNAAQVPFLSLEAILDKSRRALALGKLAQFKALLTERKAQVASSIAETETMVSSLPSGQMRVGGYEGLERSKLKMNELFGELDKMQLSYAESIENLYAFAATQDGRMEVTKDGQLLFADPAALAQVQLLIKKIEEQELLLNAATARADKTSQSMKIEEELMRKEAEAIISK